jgi:subtilase family protein
VLHGLSQRAQAGVSPGFRRRATVGMAVGLSLAFIAASSTPALADQARRNEWWLRTLHVTNAWQTTRGSGVTIAVLDTGVVPKQADLAGSVTTGPDYTKSGETPGPSWGIHGTEVASLIAGHGHGPGQANGIIGIAPAAKILSVRVALESNDPLLAKPAIAAGLPNAIARGIKWAVRRHATVIDLPLDPVTTAGAPGAGGSSAERAAVRYALAKHLVLVAPAGDGGTDAVNYPAAYTGVISVGAFDKRFNKAPFSSRRSYVTLTAAGAGVAAASPSGGYPQLNSTSAASAVVTGIVALIQAQFPTLTPAQITHALTASTRYHPAGGKADGSGAGTVDAARALTAAAAIAESVPKSAASGTAGQAQPTQPPAHSSPIPRNIRGTLIKDAIIAGLVFLLLLGLIFAIRAWQRRNARSALRAEVRASVQPPIRKPVVAKSARGAAKPGSPAGAAAGADGPDAETAEPQLEPAGFIAAPLGPAPGASGFTGSASSGFTGSAAGFTGSGFTGSGTGFTGSGFMGSGFAGSGFTGSGFTGSASSGFAAAGPTSAGSGGLAAPGAGINPPGGISPPPGITPVAGGIAPSAGLGAAGLGVPGLGAAGLGAAGLSAAGGISPPAGLGPASGPGSSAAGDPPGGFAASAGLGSTAGLGSSLPAAQDASPAGEATPGPAQPAGAGTGLPPWALISKDPTQAAAIPGSAFPGTAAAPPAGEAAGSEPASGAAGVTWMSSRLTQSPRQPRAQQVSGRPPWEPAPEPNSDLPWAQPPTSSGGAGSLPMPAEQVRPEMPAWEEMAQQAWPGGPKAAGLHPPVPADEPIGGTGRESGRPAGPRMVPAAGLVPPRPDSPGQSGRTENRPGYAWNTGAGVEGFRAAQADPGTAPGATGTAQASNGPSAPTIPSGTPPSGAIPLGAASSGAAASGAIPSGAAAADASPSAVSQPGVWPTRRPSLALPRRLGGAIARPAGGTADAGGGVNPADAGLGGQVPASGLAVPDPADGAAVGPGATGSTSGGPSWPVTGASQPPFPPAPRPATELIRPDAGQPERGPFPRAIKPPTDPGAAGSGVWSAGTIDATPSGGGQAEPVLPQGDGSAKGAGPAMGGQPGTDAAPALPSTAGPGSAKPDAAKPKAAKPKADSSRPKTGVPPWEITDSFLAVPATGPPPAAPPPAAPAASQPANPSGVAGWGDAPTTASQPSGAATWGSAPTAASQPGNPPSADADGGPADSTESFPTVASGADQRSFPRSDPDDSTESFPAARPRADLEDAFRLFPPVRGTGNRPPANGQD